MCWAERLNPFPRITQQNVATLRVLKRSTTKVSKEKKRKNEEGNKKELKDKRRKERDKGTQKKR
jgi:hypothetical protein